MVLKFDNVTTLNISENNYVDIFGVCPGCGTKVQFVPIKGCFDIECITLTGFNIITGQRCCPDSNCMTHIFFEYYKNMNAYNQCSTKIIPRNFQLYNISVEKLPEEIKSSFKEAVLCYGHDCFTASAILIRKVLENICLLNNATGKNLHEKIESLKDKVTLSKTLYDAMFELKYLGNDAAHFESKHFEKIEQNEAEIGLTILIEILRALYEHEDLINSFKALKHL